MYDLNMWIIPIAGLIPFITGFIWYNPKVMSTAWMLESGFSEEKIKAANKGLVIGFTYFFACLLAFIMIPITIHQMGIQSVVMNEVGFGVEGSELNKYVNDFFSKYGRNFRTFEHGALHGTIAGLFIAFPIVGTRALFERKSLIYIFINAGYWVITMLLMGGVICRFA